MLNNCELVLYAGKQPRVVVYRHKIMFHINVLFSYVSGKIDKEDLIAYRMNSIYEECADVHKLIENKCFVNPQLFVEFKSNYDEQENLLESLCKTEKETDKDLLKEKLNKYFDELY
jgi:hypothetical protein